MSVTRVLNANLAYIALASFILLLGLLIYRIAHILVSLVLDAMLVTLTARMDMLGNRGGTKLQRFAQLGLVGNAAQFACVLLLAAVRLLVSVFNAMCTVVLALLPFVVLSCVLALVQLEWYRSIAVLTDLFSSAAFTNTLHAVVLTPLQVIEAVTANLVPLWNLGVYVFLQAPMQLLMWLLRGDGAYHLTRALHEVAATAPAIVAAGRDFVAANSPGACPTAVCLSFSNSSNSNSSCVGLSAAMLAQGCLNPAHRELELEPALGHLRSAAAHVLLGLGTSCTALGLLLNVTLYPAVDPSLWYAADRVANAFLTATVVAPITAAQRCGLIVGGFEARPAMCMPDFSHTFELLAQAALSVGDVITHWLDALFVLLFDQSTIQVACGGNNGGGGTTLTGDDPATRALFGPNVTVLVRLTDATFALTDGVSVVWVDDGTLQKKAYAPQAWPIAANPAYGVARVLLADGASMGLLGCACVDDNDAGLRLQCAVISRATSGVILPPAAFSLASEARLLTCDRVRVSVETLRWQQTHAIVSQFSPTRKPTAAAAAAVWVIPICGGGSKNALACLPERTFTRGVCFPYCLGVLLASANGGQPLILRGAAEWNSGVLLSARDCSAAAAASTPTAAQKQAETTCTVGADAAGAGLPQSATGAHADCAYSATCTAFVGGVNDANRTHGFDVQTPIHANDGARLVLDGQPLVLSGGTFIRQTLDGERLDFPTLVNDRSGEFSFDNLAPAGVAAFGDMPPYVQANGVVPMNPAVLLPDQSMMWVANPSYDAFQAFAQYCATQGRVSETQLMLLSNYRPMRLQRALLVQSDLCYQTVGGQQVCSTNNDDAVKVEVEVGDHPIPALSSNEVQRTGDLYDLCASGAVFDLYAERLEFFDGGNVAIAVRQGTMADLGRLLMMSSSAPFGRTVFYFASTTTTNTTTTRQGRPFQPPAYGLDGTREDVTLLFQTCPALRVLPDAGAVAGHSLAALVRFAGTGANAALNPFAVLELLEARGARACPEDALGHGALADCGSALYSLDAAFAETYAASSATWAVIAWAVGVVLPSVAQSETTTQQVLSHFLEGAAVVGDATHLVAMYDVPDLMSFADVGIERLLQGDLARRRRLMGLASSMASAGRSAAASGGGSVVGHVSGAFKYGIKGFFSLARNLISAVLQGAVFSGADLGAVVASQSPPATLAIAAVGAPAVAWSHFTYRVLSVAVIDVVARARNGDVSVAPLFRYIHDALDAYETLIHARHTQACAGLRWMLGYSTQLGRYVYYNCRAGADLARATLLLGDTFFVDMLLYRCLCVSPGGQDYLAYALAHCADYIPATRMGYWQSTLAAAATGGVPAMCRMYLSGIENQTYSLFDPWLVDAMASVEALGSVLNELTRAATGSLSHSSSCKNTALTRSNPSAVVLMPLPIAHYQVCGKTDACRALCADPIQVFEFQRRRVAASGGAMTVPYAYDMSVESPFFNRYNSDDASAGGGGAVMAMASLPVANATDGCRAACGSSSNASRCLAALLHRGDDKDLRVDFFCMPDPALLRATVFPTGVDGFDLGGSAAMRAKQVR